MSIDVPFISIIIPTYKRSDALKVCVHALGQLEYPSARFEVIVVDDGGEIPLQPLLEPISKNLHLRILWQPNAGPSAARNRGAAHAAGELLAFTDDDCVPASGWLQAFATASSTSPTSLLGGRTVNALRDNPYAETSQLIIDVVYEHYNRHLLDAQFFASNNMAIPAKLYRALGGFRSDFRTSEDRDLCDRWKSGGQNLRYVPDAVIYHAHPLTLRSFWNQHAGYGRGAWLYHVARARRGAGPFRPDWTFYRNLLCAPFLKTFTGPKLYAFALLMTAQVANAAGCFAQARRGLFRQRQDNRSDQPEQPSCHK